MSREYDLDLDVYNFGKHVGGDECVLYLRGEKEGSQYIMSGDIVSMVAALFSAMVDDKSGDLAGVVIAALELFDKHQKKIQLN